MVIRTPAPEEYTEEYFLTDCGGHEEYSKGRLSIRHRKALEYLKVQQGEAILDIGCGRGELLQACSEKGANPIGIDYSLAAIGISRKFGENIVLIRASATALPFRDGVFDKVIMLDIVEHLAPNDLLKCLEDVKSVLKKDGEVFIHTPNQWGDFIFAVVYRVILKLRSQSQQKVESSSLGIHNYSALHVNVLNPISLKRTLRKAGFKSKIWFAGNPLQNLPYLWFVLDRIFFFLTTLWCKAYKA